MPFSKDKHERMSKYEYKESMGPGFILVNIEFKPKSNLKSFSAKGKNSQGR